MKKKVVFGVGLVLALVLTLGVGFFLNSKNNTKKEVDLSVAAPVMATYIEEQYGFNSAEEYHDNQEKIITIEILSLERIHNLRKKLKNLKNVYAILVLM